MKPVCAHYPTRKLGDFLTDEQIKETLRIMQLPVDEIEQTKQLKAYYNKIHDELLAKGVLSDFLAYAVPYWIRKNL